MTYTLDARFFECPQRRAQGPLLLNATGPHGPFVAQRSTAGQWTQLAALPTALAPQWTQGQDSLACEVLFLGACEALWPGQDPWPLAATPEPAVP